MRIDRLPSPTGIWARPNPACVPADGFRSTHEDPWVDSMTALRALRQSAPARPHVAWEAPLTVFLRTAPAIGPDGTVYAMGSDNTLRAFDWKTGRPLWEIERRGGILGSQDNYLSAGEHRVYCTTAGGEVLALNASNGEPLWAESVVGPLEAPPAQGPDGAMYVAGRGGILYRLNPDCGQRDWVARIGASGYQASQPVITPSGLVVVGNAEGRLAAFRAADGERAWSLPIGPEGKTVCVHPGACQDGLLLVGTSHGAVVVLDEEGRERWRHQDAPEQHFQAPVRWKDTLVAASQDQVVGLREGRVAWRRAVPEGLTTPPVVDDQGRVAVGAFDGTVQVLDAETGTPVWSGRGADSVQERPVWGPEGVVLTSGFDDAAGQPRLCALVGDEAAWTAARARETTSGASGVMVREDSIRVGAVQLKRRRLT
ncbi:MAG: PQQ-binding-like beta-propeller repeat protein [Candidatus Eremiobacterota bacterium]